MNLADKLGWGPKRVEIPHDDGRVTIVVTPPKRFFPEGVSVRLELTAEQYEGYCRWRAGGMIQECLPHLTAVQREMLLTGLDDEAFKEAVGPVLCEDCDGTGRLYSVVGGRVSKVPCETCGGTGEVQ